MLSRRHVLKSLGLSALSLSALQAGGTALQRPLLDFEDPKFWDSVRGQFMLSKDKAFFNCGTVGVMPRVVFEKLTEHSRYLASDVAD
jgi:hypothetical protein